MEIMNDPKFGLSVDAFFQSVAINPWGIG